MRHRNDSSADASGGDAEVIDQLERLAKLREAGVLTEDECQAQKRQLLGG